MMTKQRHLMNKRFEPTIYKDENPMFKRKPLIAFVILVILSVSAIPMVKLRNDVQAQTSEMARQPTPAALRPLVSTSTSKAAPPTSTTPSKKTQKPTHST